MKNSKNGMNEKKNKGGLGLGAKNASLKFGCQPLPKKGVEFLNQGPPQVKMPPLENLV